MIKPRQLRILLSAYACEPGKGSEPRVGWKWANGLSRLVDLHVLTRESNRAAIEKAIRNSPGSAAIRSATFHFYDLPHPFLWAKEKGILPTIGYYIIWQRVVARRFAREADACDVVHHLTFCSLLCPGFWRLREAAFVIGPVGAPLVRPEYISLFGNKAWQQRLRGALIVRFLKLPWVRRLLENAAAVIPANNQTRDLLVSKGIATRDVILDTGSPEISDPPPPRQYSSTLMRLIYAGLLERRKGLELSLRALARLHLEEKCEWTFDIFGSGPDRERLESLTEELGLKDRVRYHGSVPYAELTKQFHVADVFLFTSVRDTSGGVNLEAMAHGLPVICIAHQGVGDITDERCAERIDPGPIAQTIQQLAAAILRLARDPKRRAQMGLAAAHRARLDFSWDVKFDRMLQIYHEVSPH